MRIQSFQVINYKTFADSGEMRLEPSFNVIVGRNNVGKTALAEAMSLRFPSKPHRSMNTLPTPDTPISQDSRTEISIRLEANELVELLIREMPTFYVPTEAQEAPAGRATFRTVLSEGSQSMLRFSTAVTIPQSSRPTQGKHLHAVTCASLWIAQATLPLQDRYLTWHLTTQNRLQVWQPSSTSGFTISAP